MTDLDKQIKVTVIKAPSAELADQSSPLSIYIYIAGLLVSLSGMYAATYSMADTNLALILRALVVCGYCVSYWLRRNNIDIKQYQAPLLVVFATVMYFVASTAPELSSATSSNGAARPYEIQVVVIWIAVLQSFTLCADSAILFACVPSMALIGIMSSGTPDDEVQYAFYVFIASATFLMVHENHLRTRTAMAQRNRSILRQDNRLFLGEIVLVGCCVIGTMMLATVVATPIEIVGRALRPSSNHDSSNGPQYKQNVASATVHVDEMNSMDLGTGPRTESDVELLSVTCSFPIPYLRGSTYDYYTGVSFENRMQEDQEFEPAPPDRDIEYGYGYIGDTRLVDSHLHVANKIDMKPYKLDPGTGRMDGATRVDQDIRVLGGTITHLYGAPAFETVYTNFDGLRVSKAGAVSTTTPMIQGRDYVITSLVPSYDSDVLRSTGTDYPASVVPRYLQVSKPGEPHNQRLQTFAVDCTRGKTNPYDKVEALRFAIANRCKYNLQAPEISHGQDVVEGFLFDTRQGYCDSFAAALTVLCRYANVPARLASGFIQGDRQGDGTYIVREKHKHAWTEVYFTNIGWVPFDATEGTQDITPSSNSGARMIASPLKWLTTHGYGPPAIMLLVLILIGYVIKTEVLSRFGKKRTVDAGYEPLPVSNMEIVQLYKNACSALARSGLSRPLHLTPTEYRLGLVDRLATSTDAGLMLNELTNLHQKFAYGTMMASEDDVSAARIALARLIAAIASLPKPIPGEQQRSN